MVNFIGRNYFEAHRLFNSEKKLEIFDSLNHCLERKDYVTIIKAQKLFWLAYCKTFFSHQGKTSSSFFLSMEGKNIKISGEEGSIKQVQDLVEDIRTFFLEGLENKKNFEILVVNSANSIYLKKESKCIDLRYTLGGYFEIWYHNFIKPALPDLAEICGAFYIEDKKQQLVRSRVDKSTKTESVEVIRINWKEEAQLIYPISPKIIPEQKELGEVFYSLFQEKKRCDYTLVTKDGTIEVHSILLYLNGGPVLQQMLDSKMKETIGKVISFAEFSQSTVQAFLDYVYLGGKAFLDKAISLNSKNEINVFELFELANRYQIETLIDCCTNLISRS